MIKNKKFIISIGFVVALNVLAIFGCWLMFSNIQEKRDAVFKMRQEIEADERQLANAKSLKILLKDLQREKEKIAASFLGPQDFIKFIEEIESLASRAGVGIELESAALPAQKEQSPFLQFRISGSFVNVFHYLVLMENLPYQTSFQELWLVKDEDKNTWKANFKVKLLSYVPI
jgi:hypothetical protein